MICVHSLRLVFLEIGDEKTKEKKKKEKIDVSLRLYVCTIYKQDFANMLWT